MQKAPISLRMLVYLVLCYALFGCGPPDFGDSEAGLVLQDLASGLTTSRLEAQTPAPVVSEISYRALGESRVADLYVSPEGARAGIVLVPGVVARGKDDPRLVAVARSLARARFAVLVPDMPGVRSFRMRASDAREVADAFAWLVTQPELSPQGRAGIAGFSYGAAPVLIAALQPDIRQRVRFLLCVGGYYNLRQVVTYITTGFYLVVDELGTARRKRSQPHPYALGVFTRSNLDLLERPADRRALRRYADYLLGQGIGDDEPVIGKLGPDARAFYDLLSNQDPQRVAGLLQQLPPRIRGELDGIDPSAQDLIRLQAQVLLLHGRGDNLIPYTESLALAQALPPDQVQLFVIDGLAHVDLRPEPQDLPQLLGILQALLTQRLPEDNPRLPGKQREEPTRHHSPGIMQD